MELVVFNIVLVVLALFVFFIAILRWLFRINHRVKIQKQILAELEKLNSNFTESKKHASPVCSNCRTPLAGQKAYKINGMLLCRTCRDALRSKTIRDHAKRITGAKGFSLVELLVVVVIAVILVTLTPRIASSIRGALVNPESAINAVLNNSSQYARANSCCAGVRFIKKNEAQYAILIKETGIGQLPTGETVTFFAAIEGRKPIKLPGVAVVGDAAIIFSKNGQLENYLSFVCSDSDVFSKQFPADTEPLQSTNHLAIYDPKEAKAAKDEFAFFENLKTRYINKYTGELI